MPRQNPTIDGGIDPSDYVPTVNTYYGEIEKFARQTFDKVNGFNPLSVFKEGVVDNGTVIEQTVVELAQKNAWDKTGAGAFTANDPSLQVKLFQDWTDGQYQTTVRDSEIRKILIAGKSVDDLAGNVVGVLVDSRVNDEYQDMKANLLDAKTDMTTAGAIDPSSTTKGQDLITLLKNTVDSFRFVNSDYVPANYDRRANINDVKIIMPYQIANILDVSTLAYVYQLQKDEILPEIIITDLVSVEQEGEEGSEVDVNKYYVFVVERGAIFEYTRLDEVSTEYNAKGRFMNYYRTVDDLYGHSPLFKQTFIDASAMI